MKGSPARKSLPLLNRYHLQSESAHPPGGTSTAEGQMAKFKPKKPHRFYNGVAEQDGHLMRYMLLVPGQYQISKRSFFGRIVYFFATSAAGTRKPVILPWRHGHHRFDVWRSLYAGSSGFALPDSLRSGNTSGGSCGAGRDYRRPGSGEWSPGDADERIVFSFMDGTEITEML